MSGPFETKENFSPFHKLEKYPVIQFPKACISFLIISKPMGWVLSLAALKKKKVTVHFWTDPGSTILASNPCPFYILMMVISSSHCVLSRCHVLCLSHESSQQSGAGAVWCPCSVFAYENSEDQRLQSTLVLTG